MIPPQVGSKYSEIPERMQPQRLYTRYSFSAPATITHTPGVEIPAEVTNISVGGCRLLSGVQIAVGMRVIIKIQKGSDYFEAPAKVVHCTEGGIGVMFHNENPQSFLVLTKWVHEAMECAKSEGNA